MTDPPLADVTVQPRVALALLEALRTSDTPSEVLEAEDFSQSLPRRLGLSAVIASQIQRYEALQERNRELDASEVVDLFQLISRRPDASSVFRRAGDHLSREELGGRSAVARGTTRILPDFAARALALRRLRRLAAAVSPYAGVRSERKPPSLIVEGCLPAFACDSPKGCLLLTGPVQSFLGTYLGIEAEVVHPLCEARGDSACVWRLDPERETGESSPEAAAESSRGAAAPEAELSPESQVEEAGGPTGASSGESSEEQETTTPATRPSS